MDLQERSPRRAHLDPALMLWGSPASGIPS
jgi:hypothetical protein